MKGQVKWWNDAKGYGFLSVARDTPSGAKSYVDVFAHYADIQAEGFKTLREGETVDFDLYETVKGPQAKNIRREE